MRRIALVFVVAAMMAASMAFSASAAFAIHPHYLMSKHGTCVEDVASGQTSKGEGEDGFHKFHDHVHKGQPGLVAFEKENNPVSVGAEPCQTG